MVEGVPIKVKIGLRANGHADHPDWGLLPMAQSGGNPDSEQIVKWHYDKQSGHDDDTVDSPKGMQWGMMIVTAKFASEAVAMFPTLVTVMTEAEAQAFWEGRAMAHLPDNQTDTAELQSLVAERDLRQGLGKDMADINRRIEAALDPDNIAPGVRRQTEKTWTDAKTRHGITIKP